LPFLWKTPLDETRFFLPESLKKNIIL